MNQTIQEAPNGRLWPTVNILVLNWNGRTLLQNYLPTLTQLTYPGHYQITLVDNHSEDESVVFVQEEYPDIAVIVNTSNLGFSRGINAGLRQMSGDVMVLLNNDVEVRPDWLTALIKPMLTDERVGICGAKLYFPDGRTLQHAGATVHWPRAIGRHRFYRQTDTPQAENEAVVDYVTGASMAIRREVLDRIGLLDETFSPFYYEEVDFCLRAAAAGFKVLYVPTAIAIHHESLSINQLQDQQFHNMHRNRLAFILKYEGPGPFQAEFAPAEVEWLQMLPQPRLLYLMRRIYLEIILQLPALLRPKGNVAQLPLYQQVLLDLAQTAVSLTEANHAQETAEWQELREFDFATEAGKMRQAWHNVAGKWALRHIAQQQTAFNRHAHTWLSAQTAQDQAIIADINLLTAELAAQQMRFAEATAQIAALQEQVRRLENQLKEKS